MDRHADPVQLAGPADWWREAVVYQVYPRSFSDSDGDGLGDIRGIIERVGHIASLGVDAVWLSPFYPSQLADGGYDVDDHRAVDPRLGTLADFDELVQALHSRGIRLFVDVVPNHSSDRHAWFREALDSPAGSAARERYIFREGRGPDGSLPPSDLASHFGPHGWTRVADGQWYMHLFAKEQPDFNWGNPEVHEDFLKTLGFWADRGVDGFRIDVAHALVKDLDPLPHRQSFHLSVMKDDGTDPLFDRDDVHEIYREWRRLFDQYDPPRVAVAEAWVHPHRRPAYASLEGLGQAFNFDLLIAPWDGPALREVIEHNLALASQSGSSSTWVLSNHDVVRHRTRYGLPDGLDEHEWFRGGPSPLPDLTVGLQRARAATLMIMALPGSTYLYQGEELGLPEVIDIPADRIQDPQWIRSAGQLRSRDGCRVPLPWQSSAAHVGFSTAEPHLPQPSWWHEYAVDRQDGDPASTLSLYRWALTLRRRLRQDAGGLQWLDLGDDVIAFRRDNGWACITTVGAGPVPLPDGEVLVASREVVDRVLPTDATAWVLLD